MTAFGQADEARSLAEASTIAIAEANELDPGGAVQPSPSAEYLELTRLVRERGLLEKQPGYYA